jgi:hypothetical protein
MSTLSTWRLTPVPNSRLTGDRQTATAGAIVRHAPEKLSFHGVKREQDATPSMRPEPFSRRWACTWIAARIRYVSGPAGPVSVTSRSVIAALNSVIDV